MKRFFSQLLFMVISVGALYSAYIMTPNSLAENSYDLWSTLLVIMLVISIIALGFTMLTISAGIGDDNKVTSKAVLKTIKNYKETRSIFRYIAIPTVIAALFLGGSSITLVLYVAVVIIDSFYKSFMSEIQSKVLETVVSVEEVK